MIPLLYTYPHPWPAMAIQLLAQYLEVDLDEEEPALDQMEWLWTFGPPGSGVLSTLGGAPLPNS